MVLVRTVRYFPTILIVLLAVFNDGAMIALSKDRVHASPLPDTWSLRNIFVSGGALVLGPVSAPGLSLLVENTCIVLQQFCDDFDPGFTSAWPE